MPKYYLERCEAGMALLDHTDSSQVPVAIIRDTQLAETICNNLNSVNRIEDECGGMTAEEAVERLLKLQGLDVKADSYLLSFLANAER